MLRIHNPAARPSTAVVRLRPFLLPALLAGAAVGVGGTPAILLGFLALLLVLDHALDRALGPGGWDLAEAQQTFDRLARRRSHAELERRLHHATHGDGALVYLGLDSGPAAMAQRHPLGVQTIAIASVVGTVDLHKSVAFDDCFRPPSWSRRRWTQMYCAAQRGAQLPPIAVYRLGDEHFVRDGHHRVSVARAAGAKAIEADVVELVPPSPGHGPARLH